MGKACIGELMKRTPLNEWIRHKIGARQQTLSREALESWQLLKLNETLARVRAKSSFYRRHFDRLPEQLNTLADLALFPFTTADDLRRNPLQFVCISQDEIQRVVTLQTSGTTGEPKRLYFSKEDQALTIDFFGVGMSTLVEAGERVMICLPVEKSGSVGDLLRIGLQDIGAVPIPYGPVKDAQDALETIQSQDVDSIVGSPTQLLGLARRWHEAWKAPRTVLLSTDFVPDAIKQVLEDVWGCEVYNHYGTTEMGLGGGVECAAHQGYHLREADLYFEMIDPVTGKVLPDGEYGEVVFSTLTRKGMPLIRYRMGDCSRFIPERCPCGSKLRLMETISGRFENEVTVAGKSLSLREVDEALFPIPGLLDFKAKLEEQDGKPMLFLDVFMLSDDGMKSAIESALARIPAMEQLVVQMNCAVKTDSMPDLRKRILLDKRQEHFGFFH